jgi:hypothetical protein
MIFFQYTKPTKPSESRQGIESRREERRYIVSNQHAALGRDPAQCLSPTTYDKVSYRE